LVIGDFLRGVSSATSEPVRRRAAIGILVAVILFLGFLAYETWRLSRSNEWLEIVHTVKVPFGWLVLSLVTAALAVMADRSEKRHAVAVATAGATAAGTDMSGTRVVASQPWRGAALAGLAVVAFSLALISSSQLGHLRSENAFVLRKKENVAWCAQRQCQPDEQKPASCSGAAPCLETIEPCVASLWAPANASTEEQVPVDLSISCPRAKPQQMPNAKAAYGAKAAAVTSFENAKTENANERVWRWFVTFPKGEQPVDVHLSFAGDDIAVPLVRIQVSQPTTLAGLQESTTAIGGLLTALVGVLGTLGALLKGLRARSATVIAPDAETAGAPPP
jgi:hypothetical protein